MGDFGCHILDPVFTALGPHRAAHHPRGERRLERADLACCGNHPVRISRARSSPPGRRSRSPGTMADARPIAALAQLPEGKKLPSSGSLFIGEGGTLILPHVGMPQLYPQEKFATFEMKKEAGLETTTTPGWTARWSNTQDHATTSSTPARSPRRCSSGMSPRACPGTTLEWDAANLRIANEPKARSLAHEGISRRLEDRAGRLTICGERYPPCVFSGASHHLERRAEGTAGIACPPAA